MADAEEIRSYRDLRVWQRAMDTMDIVLDMTETGPLSRKYRLAGQFEAAAASVPANISEGHELATLRQYLKHLFYARGSLAEARTYLEMFQKKKYVEAAAGQRLWDMYLEVGKMLNALITSLERRLPFEDEIQIQRTKQKQSTKRQTTNPRTQNLEPKTQNQ